MSKVATKMVTILHDVTVTTWGLLPYVNFGVCGETLELFQERKDEFATMFQTIIVKISHMTL